MPAKPRSTVNAARDRVRDGLRYEERRLRVRLHPHVRPRRRPSYPGGKRWLPCAQPWLRPRVLGPQGARNGGGRGAETSMSSKDRGTREVRRCWWPTCRRFAGSGALRREPCPSARGGGGGPPCAGGEVDYRLDRALPWSLNPLPTTTRVALRPLGPGGGTVTPPARGWRRVPIFDLEPCPRSSRRWQARSPG